MKYSTASLLALASLSVASPLPQFSFPAFPRPSGGFSFGDFSIPSFGGGLTRPTASSNPIPSVPGTTPTGGASQPIATANPGNGNNGGGTIGSNCTPQSTTGRGTENGIKDKNCCTDLTVIFARGTGETGNVGTISGPPMFKSLREKLGAQRVTVQGVDYPASSAGNAQLGASGGPTMASLISTALSQCPNSKIVVSGYSQGAMVVHNALGSGSASSQVAGAVLFGDPLIRQGVGSLGQDKIKQFCGTSDTICGQAAGGVSGGHLSYGSVAGQAADFVISAAGLK